jgi:hypothetical protein
MTSRGAAENTTAKIFYRSIVGHEDLTVSATNLPAGAYDVAVDGTVIGSCQVSGS